MNNLTSSYIEKIIHSWIKFVLQNRIKFILSFFLLTIWSVFYIKNNLSISTDTTDMLSEKLHWRQLDSEYERQFPQFLKNIVIIIEADTPDKASNFVKKISDKIESDIEPNYINDIYIPSQLPFIKRSAFLFLNYNELENISDRLAIIQPFLGSLTKEQNIKGFFNMFSKMIDEKQNNANIEIKPLLQELNYALEDENYNISWQLLINPLESRKQIYREFIILKVKEDEKSLIPNKEIIQSVNKVIESVNSGEEVNVKLTGDIVLSYEELYSVFNANFYAIFASFILVSFILIFGLGPIRFVFASIITLLSGLIITTAFATATVGELNLISVAFAVLYIGLGIDFSIHIVLRYREEKYFNQDNSLALKKSITYIFNPLFLCTITTAIAFYSFLPTNYKGVAELGFIAGSGIFISFIINLSLLPAIISFDKLKEVESNFSNKTDSLLNTILKLPYKYTKLILSLTIVIVVILLARINQINFDPNILNLQDPKNSSVIAYRELLKNSDTSPWKAVLLEKNLDKVKGLINEIEELSLVDKAMWLGDFIPAEQEDKLLIIEDMGLLMGLLSNEKNKSNISDEHRRNIIKKLIVKLNNYEQKDSNINKLRLNLDKLLNATDSNTNKIRLKKFEAQILNNFGSLIENISTALAARSVSKQDIPKDIYKRWISDNGYYRLEIHPKNDLNNNKHMREFVTQVKKYNKNIIGPPIVNIEAGDAVVKAFSNAFIYAFISILLLLLFLVKVKRNAVIILISVIVGAILTSGIMIFIGLPINFANVIALPLLLGIGVDSGIHIAERFHQKRNVSNNKFITSSSRGVIISSLTTIFSTGNLAFSSHVGMASMGALLSIGLTSMLISTLIVLPAFLNLLGKKS